jgi:hypothetical protein
MALATLRQWVLASPWAGLLKPQGKLQKGAAPSRTQDEQVQATLAALMARAEGRAPEDARARRAMCFSTALEMKFNGNSSFKQGAYADASSAYELGLDALEALARIDVDAVRRGRVSCLPLRMPTTSIHPHSSSHYIRYRRKRTKRPGRTPPALSCCRKVETCRPRCSRTAQRPSSVSSHRDSPRRPRALKLRSRSTLRTRKPADASNALTRQRRPHLHFHRSNRSDSSGVAGAAAGSCRQVVGVGYCWRPLRKGVGKR